MYKNNSKFHLRYLNVFSFRVNSIFITEKKVLKIEFWAVKIGSHLNESWPNYLIMKWYKFFSETFCTSKTMSNHSKQALRVRECVHVCVCVCVWVGVYIFSTHTHTHTRTHSHSHTYTHTQLPYIFPYFWTYLFGFS